jgi:hypothetical protein
MLRKLAFVVPLTALLTLGALRSGLASERQAFVVKAGVMEAATAGTDRLRETAVVTMDPSRRPGWCFVVDPPNSRPYELYSIHHLPSPPKSLTGDFQGMEPALAVRGIKTDVQHVDGIRTSCFDFSSGDPLGEYRVEVFINGTPTTTLRLEVVAPGRGTGGDK